MNLNSKPMGYAVQGKELVLFMFDKEQSHGI